MRIAAIVAASDNSQLTADSVPASALSTAANFFGVNSEILGSSLLDRTLTKLKAFGLSEYTIVSTPSLFSTGSYYSSDGHNSDVWHAAWADTAAGYVNHGIDLLLLLGTNAYSDVDLGNLVRFHLENNQAFTQVQAKDGMLDLAVVSAAALRDASARELKLPLAQRQRFSYRGYVNRLASLQDFYSLVEDGLYGRCGLSPIGAEVRDRVWQGADAEVDESAVVTGPAFVGADSRVAACCKVAPGCALERGCEVDCGTTIAQCWVAANTYLGVALDVRRCLVRDRTLFHLDRNVEVDISDDRLVGAAAKFTSLLASLGSLFRTEAGAN